MNGTDNLEQQAQQAQPEHAQPEQTAMACCRQGADAPSSGWRNRRTLAVVAAAVAVGTGMFLNWGWLVAAGVAPLILSLLPCLIMCGLGLCASRWFGRSARSREVAGSSEAPKPGAIE